MGGEFTPKQREHIGQVFQNWAAPQPIEVCVCSHIEPKHLLQPPYTCEECECELFEEAQP